MVHNNTWKRLKKLYVIFYLDSSIVLFVGGICNAINDLDALFDFFSYNIIFINILVYVFDYFIVFYQCAFTPSISKNS